MVVGIIAIIGGAMISSFAGNEVKAARGVATQTIAGIESAVRVFTVETKRLPNNLESLVCAPYSGTGIVSTANWGTTAETVPKSMDAVVSGTALNKAADDTAYKYGGESNVAGIGGGMTMKLAQKFIGHKLTSDEADALTNLGMSSLRYAMSEACDTDSTTLATLADVNGASGTFGASTEGLSGIDIPNQAFADPRPSGTSGFKLRGVGFKGDIATGTPVLRWYKGSDPAVTGTGTSGYNNLKVGAAENDILIALGIGQDSDLIGTTLDAKMSKAPFYGQVGKDKYAHYIGLFNITTDNVQLQAVVDARGDFLDEEIAEFQGQKT